MKDKRYQSIADSTADGERSMSKRMTTTGLSAEERKRMLSRVGSMRRASMESTSSSKTATSLKNTAAKLKGKLGKKARQEQDRPSSHLNFQEEMDQQKQCYEAELFQLRECLLKDERAAASLQDQIAEKHYLLRKSDLVIRDLQSKIEEQGARFKQNEENLEQQLVDLSQSHQRLIERHQDLERTKESLEGRVNQLVAEIDGGKLTIKDLHGEVRAVTHAASAVEDSLKKAISIARRENYDLRALHTRQEKELALRLDQVQEELTEVVSQIDRSLLPEYAKSKSAEFFESSLDFISLKYQNVLAKCRLRASRFNDSLLQVSSLHSNLPRHIKEILLQRSPEALVQLVDTLSFEINVQQYLEAMFPPPDLSFLRKKYPHTPSAAMMHGEVFTQHNEEGLRPHTAPQGTAEQGTLRLAAGLAGTEIPKPVPGAKYLAPLTTS